jgi:hypothetical protein
MKMRDLQPLAICGQRVSRTMRWPVGSEIGVDTDCPVTFHWLFPTLPYVAVKNLTTYEPCLKAYKCRSPDGSTEWFRTEAAEFEGENVCELYFRSECGSLEGSNETVLMDIRPWGTSATKFDLHQCWLKEFPVYDASDRVLFVRWVTGAGGYERPSKDEEYEDVRAWVMRSTALGRPNLDPL